MAYKQKETINNNLSNLFKVTAKTIDVLLGLARSEERALRWAHRSLGMKGLGEVKALINFIAAGGELVSDDEADADDMNAIDVDDLMADDNASSFGGSDGSSFISETETIGETVGGDIDDLLGDKKAE
jgi:hypothetical protein